MPGDKHSKTEKPTGKKLSQAREQGSVAKSQDLSQTTALISGMIMFIVMFPHITNKFAEVFRTILLDFDFSNVALHGINQIVFFWFKTVVLLSLPTLAVVWITVFAVAAAQVGIKFSFKAIQPKLDKLNPVNGFQKLFSVRGVINVSQSLVKMVIIGVFTSQVLLDPNNTMVLLHLNETYAILMKTGSILWELLFKSFMVLIIMAAVDWFYQKWQFSEDQKMTKQEVKDEHKQQEGNPEIKGKVKGRQRDASQRRGLKENVQTADVVVVNPFHIAVAIRYDRSSGDEAPIVVAKGARLLAQRIREFAQEAGIEIIQNIPLARALYKQCNVDFEITPDLYVAVAEVLAVVFRKRNKQVAR